MGGHLRRPFRTACGAAILPGMSQVLVVLITAPEAEASALADSLVARRLVACVNIVAGMQSVFHWEGRVESEAESLLICKTSPARYADLEAALPALHSYDVPECIAVASDHALAAYAQWVRDETTPEQDT